jgi:diguanylate cyclase (GGDEF)-like protein
MPGAMIAMRPTSPIVAPAAAAAARTPWNQFRRRWGEWMVGRPEDHLIAGSWTPNESRAALYLGLLLLLLLPALIGLGFGPPDTPGRLVLVAAAVAAVFSASEVEVQRRSRGVALLPLMAGLVYGLAVSAAFAAVLWAEAPEIWTRHTVLALMFPLLVLATSLRGDPRLCAASGLFCALGYLSVVAATPMLATSDPEKGAALARQLDATNVAAHGLILFCVTAYATLAATRERTLRRAAHCDPLTGLIGAETFERCLEREARRSMRAELPLSVALIDLDRFRQVNEAHGHAFGDAILRWVADLLRESVRNTDLVARLPGERFCVAFLDSEHPALVGRLEALRREVSGVQIQRAGLSEPVRLTLSAGLARFPREGTHVEEVMAIALERLHAAKRAGRDRIVA